MNIKIQSKGIAGEANHGSSRGYVEYIGHENSEKEAAGHPEESIPVHDRHGMPVTAEEAIAAIDGNRFHLGRNDAKFYSVIFSFSEQEVAHMGEGREQRIESAHRIVAAMMDRYAEGFGHDDIKDHEDLLYFYGIHEHRGPAEDDSGPGLHVHVVVSRNDASGRHKMSPVTAYRKGSETGVIRHGFCRDGFFRDCEKAFDGMFGYDRPLSESYAYYNTMRNGTTEERLSMADRLADGMHVTDEVFEALSRRALRLADEADSEEGQKAYRQLEQGMSEEKRLRNGFWNSYNSYYKPHLQDLKKLVSDALALYGEAKEKYSVEDAKSKDMYGELQDIYGRMEHDRRRIAIARTGKALAKAVAAALVTVQPVPVLVAVLTVSVISNRVIRNARSERHELYEKAAEIRREIIEATDYRDTLCKEKNDRLKEYVDLKTDRTQLMDELKKLRSHLDEQVETNKKRRTISRLSGVCTLSTGYRDGKDIVKEVFSIFGRNRNLLNAKVDLSTCGYTVEPIYHPNGGVADFRIKCGKVEYRAGLELSDSEFVEMLARWKTLTEQKPAFDVERELEEEQIKKETMKMAAVVDGVFLKVLHGNDGTQSIMNAFTDNGVTIEEERDEFGSVIDLKLRSGNYSMKASEELTERAMETLMAKWNRMEGKSVTRVTDDVRRLGIRHRL